MILLPKRRYLILANRWDGIGRISSWEAIFGGYIGLELKVVSPQAEKKQRRIHSEKVFT